MSSPQVHVACPSCLDMRAHNGRLEAVLAKCIRDRDEAHAALACLLRHIPKPMPGVAQPEFARAWHEARRVLGEVST